MVPKYRRRASCGSMTSERTSPPSGPVASQSRSFSGEESGPPSAARAPAGAQETSNAESRKAEDNFWSRRFFIFYTTVFKILRASRRGAVQSNRAAIILIESDFAKPAAEAGSET